VYSFDSEGKPSSWVPEDSPIKTAIRGILEELELS
ncbi:MAG: carbon monoxide dehydrogenase, partial [Clostridiales bacterium]|nr:carbon monoxide dehydrogenase [Clostridiales bacterium]